MKQFSDCSFKACFKQMCFNLKPQEYMDNNLFVNSVFNFIMRHCQAIFSSILYKTSNDQFKIYKTFCSSVIYTCHSLFVWSFKMAKISLVEVVQYCIIIFSTHVYTKNMEIITKMRNWQACLKWENLKMQ